MQVEVRLDATAAEPKVIILTSRMTDEVSAVVQMLSETEPKLIAGFRDDTVTVETRFDPQIARAPPFRPDLQFRDHQPEKGQEL